MGNKSRKRDLKDEGKKWNEVKDGAGASLLRAGHGMPTAPMRGKPGKASRFSGYVIHNRGTLKLSKPQKGMKRRHRIAARRSERLHNEGQETKARGRVGLDG